MICLSNFKSIFPATKSQFEVPDVFQEKGILYGFRTPEQPWLYYLASLFQPHNETLNMWTHLFGMIYIIFKGIQFCTEGVSLISDPVFWPLTAGLVATFLMYLLSTTAHTFQSRSELAHYIFFMCDYAGIGIYGMASGVLHFIYCSSSDFHTFCEGFFVPGCIATGVFACAGNCLSKVSYQKPYPRIRVLWQAIPILTMYVWINLPIIYRFFRYGAYGDSVYSPGLVHHGKQMLCFVAGGFLYSTNIPQVIFPGRFDILGHSHQLFHAFIIFTNFNQLSGIRTDLKHIRPFPENCPTQNLFSAFLPLLLTVFFQIVVISWFVSKLHHRESLKNKISNNNLNHLKAS